MAKTEKEQEKETETVPVVPAPVKVPEGAVVTSRGNYRFNL